MRAELSGAEQSGWLVGWLVGWFVVGRHRKLSRPCNQCIGTLDNCNASRRVVTAEQNADTALLHGEHSASNRPLAQRWLTDWRLSGCASLLRQSPAETDQPTTPPHLTSPVCDLALLRWRMHDLLCCWKLRRPGDGAGRRYLDPTHQRVRPSVTSPCSTRCTPPQTRRSS